MGINFEKFSGGGVHIYITPTTPLNPLTQGVLQKPSHNATDISNPWASKPWTAQSMTGHQIAKGINNIENR